ncbi:MAG: GDP-mannose 4,6-dehydratase [Patescibacteria group bacterium]
MKTLVTGGAGFIGSHLCKKLLDRGDLVICIDNFNDYYSPDLKRDNIAPFLDNPNFTLIEGDIRDKQLIDRIFAEQNLTHIAHLAAMAGPRHSMKDPQNYEDVNMMGTINLLQAAVNNNNPDFFFASTSSVYGLTPTPWSEDARTDTPLSVYASTKKAGELTCFTFHRTYNLPIRIARFFTVYGPHGRPDMTPRLFVDAMVKGDPVTLYNGGVGVFRDWTYVDDIVGGITAMLDSDIEFDTINLGNSDPIELIKFVNTIENITGLKANIQTKPLPPADPTKTFADITKAKNLLGYEPQTHVEQGLKNFWDWYKQTNQSLSTKS